MDEQPVFEFKCSKCEMYHKGAPSVAYPAPDPYFGLEEAEKTAAILTDDFCEIEDDRFIRILLEIPIQDWGEPFLWGAWVSLSPINYETYKKKFRQEYSARYFGWFCNNLYGYPETWGLKTNVIIAGNQSRPRIEIQESSHPLSLDFRNGMPKEKAIRIFEEITHKGRTG